MRERVLLTGFCSKSLNELFNSLDLIDFNMKSFPVNHVMSNINCLDLYEYILINVGTNDDIASLLKVIYTRRGRPFVILVVEETLPNEIILSYSSLFDDFIVRPISKEELARRIIRLKGKKKIKNRSILNVGDFSFDFISRKVCNKNQTCISLTEKEFQLVTLMIESLDCIVTREEILEKIWHDVVVGTRVVDNTVCRLNKKISILAHCSAQEIKIECVWGVGYRVRSHFLGPWSESTEVP